MSHLFNIKKISYLFFIYIFLILGIFLSLKVGITHDEYHDFFVGEANKKKFFKFFFLGQEYSTELSNGLKSLLWLGIHLLSSPIEKALGFFLEIDHVTLESKSILLKHPSVFLFFYNFRFILKIIFLITKDKNYSSICLIFFCNLSLFVGTQFF